MKTPIQKQKFGPKGIKMILVGFTNNCYIIWNPANRRFISSRHVIFNEKITYKNLKKTKKLLEKEEEQNIEELEKEKEEDTCQPRKRGRPRKQPGDTKKNKAKEAVSFGPITRSKEKKQEEEVSVVNRPTNNEEEDEKAFVMSARINKDPANFNEAMSSNDKDQWTEAIKEELGQK